MAGLPGRFPFKPLLSHSSAAPTTSAAAPSSSATATPIRTSISPLPLSSSSKSNAFRFRLHNSNSLHLLFTTSTRSTVLAQYGGVSRSSGPADSKRSDDGLGVDISAIRSNTVRLIDAQQNMVGIVSKAQAIQMADDAELDLVVLSPDADPPVLATEEAKNLRDRNMFIVLAPNKAVLQKAQEPPKVKDNLVVNEVSASV
ncbi:Translation initiation factor IF3-2, chloroplastic [Cucurbita argyrosperma subsp. argyrosperma]|nr:Translation initiation factor IF3-2, chloroplastic [Cucurbita argyrosperma subsp. argyrosperma]